MMADESGARKGPRRISMAAAAAIARDVEAARPRVLDELGWLTQRNGGALSPDQIAAAAAVMSNTLSPGDIGAALVEWCMRCGADPGAALAWLDSPAAAALLAAAARPGGRRRDLPSRALTTLWQVCADDERALDLTQVVTEAGRSRARRRAAGVLPPGPRAAPERPWEALGVSRATHYRRQSKQTATGETRRDHIKEENRARAIWSRRVSLACGEPGLRYMSRAGLLGLPLAPGADPADPLTWYETTGDPVLRAILEDELRRALANRNRRGALAAAKAAQEPRPSLEPDPQACPARVSRDLWETVPLDLRAWVRIRAGRLFLSGEDPDAAVAAALAAEQECPSPSPPEPFYAKAAAEEEETPPSASAMARAVELAVLADPPYPEAYVSYCLAALAAEIDGGLTRGARIAVEAARDSGFNKYMRASSARRGATQKRES